MGIGLPPTRMERRVEAALETVGLGGFPFRRASSLSRGEAQRVALARALVLSTRDPSQAQRLDDRIVRLEEGRIVEVLELTAPGG